MGEKMRGRGEKKEKRKERDENERMRDDAKRNGETESKAASKRRAVCTVLLYVAQYIPTLQYNTPLLVLYISSVILLCTIPTNPTEYNRLATNASCCSGRSSGDAATPSSQQVCMYGRSSAHCTDTVIRTSSRPSSGLLHSPMG